MLQITNERIPVFTDEGGVARIAGTRVRLACLVEMFDEGASPEEIVDEYDVLGLDDVYAVITYYLRHHDEVKAHLAEENRESDQAVGPIQQRFPSALRDKLLAAKREREQRDS